MFARICEGTEQMQKSNFLGGTGTVFWVLEGILYTVFLTGDWCDFLGVLRIDGFHWYKYSSICKYTALLICVWYGCRCRREKRNVQQKALCGVLLFAAAADYFLLFTNCFILGVCFFCLVQVCYCLYFPGEKSRNGVWGMVIPGICMVLFVWCLMQTETSGDGAGWKGEKYGLILAAVFYGSLLVQNLVRIWKSSPPICIWGKMAILLLFLCDVHVALYNIEAVYITVKMSFWFQWWCEAAGVLMWLFYLPSQLCIVKCIQGKIPINNRNVDKNLL